MLHILVSWHKFPLKFWSWSITLQTKRVHQITNFQIFECSNESSPDSSCQFWNHKVKILTVHIKLHQICTFIDCFCWKYIKCYAKKVQRSYVSLPGTFFFRIWRKTDLLFPKWQEFGEFWPEHSKVSKICTFIG